DFAVAHTRVACHAVSNLVEPARDRLALVNRPRPTYQNQKRCLKSVIRGVAIVQEAPAKSQDHRSMPPKQQFEGVLVALPNESVKKSGIGNLAGAGPGNDPLQLLEHAVQRLTGHDTVLPTGLHGGT